ncbi:MAG TPA: FAD-binding and (Fe-S)-binding domain-containing protein [Gemmatimonadaceae bacterium]|nr:FAD-binding and (Fe-S)-binding domain-containing protein [Gemmatimonadaceae bacterium]
MLRRVETPEDLGLHIDARALERDLRAGVRGDVLFDAGHRVMYAHDASNYRQVPIGVVRPRDAGDVVAAVEAARRHGAPVLARGGGTGIPGQSVNVAVVLDFSRYMTEVVEVDPAQRRARVQPGTILDTLRHAAERHALTFGPDPATHSRNTLGGMIGNDSCGVHSVMSQFYGPGPRTADNIESLEILTYDGLRTRVGATSDEERRRIIAEGGRRGAIYAAMESLRDRYAPLIRERYPKIPRRVSGYNLDDLLPENGFHVARALVGSECTCVLVLEATVLLMPNPRARALVVLGFSDVYAAADAVPRVLETRPIACEGMDDSFLEDMRKKGMSPPREDIFPSGRGWLLVEYGGETRDAAVEAAQALVRSGKTGATGAKLFDDPAEEQLVWHLREEGLGATARVPGEKDTHEGWEDSAVPPERLGDYLRALSQLFERYGYHGPLYGHFGQGVVHTRIDFDLVTEPGIERFRAFLHDAARLVVSLGGSLSGEHGDGQARGELLPIMFGEELVEAFREFKGIWDPEWKMNPGKVVNPYRVDQNLDFGADYEPAQPSTHFRYPRDRGSFERAVTRCVGAGVCRRLSGGTMCPSYMATREERWSTRGRARLLGEMLRGDPLRGGWRNDEVREALDLCLACKGCRAECPVNVDVATYKAEFLSHYYEGRMRPPAAYAMGLIHRWARAASHAPRLVNALTHAPGLSAIAKRVAGIAPQRTIPRFASEPFTRWFRRRPVVNPGGAPVLLWPDTFNNYFFPATAKAAVRVLERAGFRVEIPPRSLCCGRPLYDWGMLDEARRLLRQVLDVLRPRIEAGVPVVGLEPSCVSVFRDELTEMMPNDLDAQRLSGRTYLLGELLRDHAPSYAVPRLARRALVHGHCHHKAIMRMDAEVRMLRQLGLDYEMPDSGCCGMAGAFGFERRHYDVAMRVGERVLLPAVRGASPDTLIIADGFSCREQIRQGTGRQALHLAEVLDLAAAGDPGV